MQKSQEPFIENVRLALKEWNSNSRHEDYGFSKLFLFRQRQRQLMVQPQLVVNELLLDALEQLHEEFPQDATLIRRRSLDGLSVRHLANQQNIAESTIYPKQRKATNRLTSTLLSMDTSAMEMQKSIMLQRLEASTYTNLVGIDEAIAQLKAVLVKQDPPWLISLEGIGGIGKTTLADALIRALIHDNLVDDIAWVSARQQYLDLAGDIRDESRPVLTSTELIERLTEQLFFGQKKHRSPEEQWHALQDRLKSVPHIIVIDNLDTLQDIDELLPTIQKLTNPTKFVLTTRLSLYGTPNVHHHKIAELNETNALKLIRQEAEISGLPLLANEQEKELIPIYKTVGGSPLALRLVVGQVHLYPLNSILTDLQMAESKTAENLYTYIYHKAWFKLEEISRRALLAMPMVSAQGGDAGFIADISGLEPTELREALNRLVTLNLVNVSSGIHERVYSIHGLTRSFLEEQVARWLE